MSNKIIICPGVSADDLIPPLTERTTPDQFFVGSRVVDNQLQFLLGAKEGDSFHITAILDEKTAEEMCQRITAIVANTSNDQETTYEHPVSVTVVTSVDAEKAPKTQGVIS